MIRRCLESGSLTDPQPALSPSYSLGRSQLPRTVAAVPSASHPVFPLKMWEKAIKLSKELAETYESKVFDYEGLGSLLVSLGQQGC